MFVLEVIKGSLKGKSFPVKRDLKIGRSGGNDILLTDSAVSDHHAEIKIEIGGRIMLSDLNSKNGIFSGGQKKIKLALKKDLEFRIGKNIFRVLSVRTPEEEIFSLLNKGLKSVSDRKKKLTPFPYVVELNFTTGIQSGESYCITYGPCVFGRNKVGGPILDEQSTDDLFCLISSSNKKNKKSSNEKKKEVVLLQTKNKDVLVNQKYVKEKAIEPNDVIFIGETQITLNILDLI